MSERDAPSFLTTPPSPQETPYRTPGVVPNPVDRITERARPVTQPPLPRPVVDDIVDGPAIGDRAGEHLDMTRGKYSAWVHVVIAFVLQIALFGFLPRLALRAVLPADVATFVAGGIGAVLAWLVYRDRWRCIEAFSSRFCSGLMNFSILYVPLVALVYGNVRGLAKLRRR